MAVCAGRRSAAENLIPNASFETGTSELGLQPWFARAWNGKEAARWKIELPGRTGQQCVSIQSTQGSDAAWSTKVAVVTNAFYRLSGWIKTDSVRGAAGALLNIQNLQTVRSEAVTGTHDWTRVEAVFGSGVLTELEINCLFGGWGSSTGQAWFDDIALERVPDPMTETPRGQVVIETEVPAKSYSPRLFGGFIEHFHRQIYGGLFAPGSPLSDSRGFRRDVIAALKEVKLSIVRWPGGCFASGYHWRDGVGGTRKPVADPVWGVEDPNTFGTSEFVEWCREVGCEPYICSNAGNGTPEEMRDWVEYCNGTEGRGAALRAEDEHQEPLGVQFWSIGNENWGGHEIGARTPAEWGPLVRRSAELMLAADPDLTLLAAATADAGWTLPLLKEAGKHLQYVAIHEYWLPCWGENLTPDYMTCILNSGGPERTIQRVVGLLEEAGCRGRVKIAFDEWNLRGWHHPGFPRKQVVHPDDTEAAQLIRARDKNDIPSQYTMADALFSASFLAACLRHAEDVGMANIAPIVNTRGPLYVHPAGLVKRTTFHVLAMFANELQSRVGTVTVSSGNLLHNGGSVAALDAVATVDETGRRWALALINRHPSKGLECAIRLGGMKLEGNYPASVLAGDSPEAYNDVRNPGRVTPERRLMRFREGVVTLPPHSLSMVQIDRR